MYHNNIDLDFFLLKSPLEGNTFVDNFNNYSALRTRTDQVDTT